LVQNIDILNLKYILTIPRANGSINTNDEKEDGGRKVFPNIK